MKPITFENLRRLMGGGRKKKDKESSFKRSDSFKRISIRKSYLDRGARKKQVRQQREAPSSVIVKALDSGVLETITTIQEIESTSSGHDQELKRQASHEGPGQSVIAYGNWLRGVRVNENPVSTSGIKGCERTIIYVPACDDSPSTNLPAPPVIRQLSSSPVFHKKLSKKPSSPILLKRKESNDSAVEMFPWGESGDLQRSPIFTRSPQPSLIPDATEEMCSLSVSLGRIWMDAPLAMAPRSLELPRQGSNSGLPAHNSLDSALKDRRDNPGIGVISNRLQQNTKVPPAVSRTLSSTSSTTASTGLFSSKDSGFSFSISIPKLSDFGPNTSQPPVAISRGFFRKKNFPKPKLSVSRDGYFKRTSGGLLELKRNSLKRKSSKKKSVRSSARRKLRKSKQQKDDMYQVVISRPARSLRNLKLDPMIFVPPEKRNPSVRRKQSFKIGLKEIRDLSYKEVEPNEPDYKNISASVDEGLYECISALSISSSNHSVPSIPSVPSSHFYDLPKSTISDNSTISDSGSALLTDDEDNSSFKSSCGSVESYVRSGAHPVRRRAPVRRKKSAIASKKPVTYVARPGITRSTSTLRRSKKKKSCK